MRQTLGAAALLLACAAASGDDPPFRVAGIVLDGAVRIALIEFPGGDSAWISEGDTVGAAEVLRIGTDRVRFAFPDGERVARLEGGPEPVPAAAATAAAHVAPDPPAEAPAVVRHGSGLTWHVDAEALIEAAELSESVLETLDVAAAGLPGGPGYAALEVLAWREPEAYVAAVQGEQVHSDTQALRLVNDRLAQGLSVLVHVSGIPGLDHIYLRPAPADPPLE